MNKWLLYSMLAFTIMLGACADTDDEDMEETREISDSEPSIETAGDLDDETDEVDVTLYNRDNEKVGTATIRSVYTGLNVTVDASGIEPGTHGFHIHEKGVCEAPDFKSAGGHFNPTDAKHGFDHEKGQHAGDLPNIEADQEGNVVADTTADMVTLEEGESNSLLKEGGTAFVIHAKADDYESQPSGDGGDRIACGVISE